MILVCLGTHYQPFIRLAEAADKLALEMNEKVIVQCGVTKYNFKHAESFDYCPKDKMTQLIEEARVIVMQGGWGAMCEAVDKKKKVVVVPRIEGKEHIHNQEQLVRKMDQLGCVIGVFDINGLADAVKKADHYHFQPLARGNAKIIIDTLEEWFGNNK